MNKLSDQKKGSLLAFIAVMFITPDSLLIRLSEIETWGMLFYRGAIPFVIVLVGLLLFYRQNFINAFLKVGTVGIFYAISFSICNITFIVSIQNTNVANTLIMIALAPMLSAILGAIFLKEMPSKGTWIAIFITFLAALFIFYDSLQVGNLFGNIMGFVTAAGLAVNAVLIRYAKDRDLLPSAVMGKLGVAVFAFFFVENFNLNGTDQIYIPVMCIICVALPFVLVTIAPRFIPAEEVNLFFLLETIIGPIWVWLVVKEQPTLETIIGGAVIIITLGIHSFIKLRETEKIIN